MEFAAASQDFSINVHGQFNKVFAKDLAHLD